MTCTFPLLSNRCTILVTTVALAFFITTPAIAISTLSESFEDGTLDPRISVTIVGGYSSTPGIQALTNFGSTQAFGFGRSICPFSCLDAHVTGLVINLGAPTLISTLSFKEMELFGNWGSGGAIFVDGTLFGTTHYDYGRLPYNDLIADQTFRSHTFNLNLTAQTIELRVRDITNQSEIFIDDLSLNGSPANPVPEPSTMLLLSGGLLCLVVLRRARLVIE